MWCCSCKFITVLNYEVLPVRFDGTKDTNEFFEGDDCLLTFRAMLKKEKPVHVKGRCLVSSSAKWPFANMFVVFSRALLAIDACG